MAWVPRCTPYRRPEKRRPPYTRAVCRVVNAPRWPPGGAAVPTVSAAGTTPTALPPRHPCRVVNARVGHRAKLRCTPYRRPEQRRPPYTRAALVGWSTPRVGHRAGLRCPPYRRPEQRRPPYARAAVVGWSTPRVGHQAGLRCTPYQRAENAARPTLVSPL